MCGPCHGLTVLESERFYSGLYRGEVKELPVKIFDLSLQTFNLRQRQIVEIEMGGLDDDPEFRDAVFFACNENGVSLDDLEDRIVQLREDYGRPHMTDAEMQRLLMANAHPPSWVADLEAHDAAESRTTPALELA